MSEKIRNIDEVDTETIDGEVVDAVDVEDYVVKFKKPYEFERKVYEEVDLSGLDNLSATDMIAVQRILQRNNRGADLMPELSMDYALEMAARAASLPSEFFYGLPAREAMKVKNRVVGFLFG